MYVSVCVYVRMQVRVDAIRKLNACALGVCLFVCVLELKSLCHRGGFLRMPFACCHNVFHEDWHVLTDAMHLKYNIDTYKSILCLSFCHPIGLSIAHLFDYSHKSRRQCIAKLLFMRYRLQTYEFVKCKRNRLEYILRYVTHISLSVCM